MPELIEQIRETVNGAVAPLRQENEALRKEVEELKASRPSDDAELNARRAELVEAARALEGAPLELDINQHHNDVMSSAVYKTLTQKENRALVNNLGNTIRGIAIMKNNGSSISETADFIEKHFRDARSAKNFRAINTQVGSAGGVMITQEQSAEFVQVLRAALMFDKLGVRFTTLNSGKKKYRKFVTPSIPGTVAEGQNISTVQPTFGFVELNAKDIAGLVPVTNDMLKDADFDANAMIVADMGAEMALKLEQQVFFGTGGSQILGLTNFPGVTTTAGTSGAGSARADLKAMDGRYWSANPQNRSQAYAMHPQAQVWAGYEITTTGIPVPQFARVNEGIFNGRKFGASTQMPYSAGATSIFQADWDDLVIGLDGQTEVEITKQGSAIDSAGNTIHAFGSNLSLIRIIQRADAVPLRTETFQILNIPNISTWSWL